MDFNTCVLDKAHREGLNLINWDTADQCLWGEQHKQRKQELQRVELRWFLTWRKGRDHPYTKKERRADEEQFKEEKRKEDDERARRATKRRREFQEQEDYDPEENEGKRRRRTTRKRRGCHASSSSTLPHKWGRQMAIEEGDDPEEIDSDNYELARGDSIL